MIRREFIAFLGGAASWPIAARAQQPTQRIRRIGALMPFAENDKIGQSWLTMFRQGLPELGWIEGRNVGIEYRFTAGNAERMRSFAAELAELHPDVILVGGTLVVGVVRPAASLHSRRVRAGHRPCGNRPHREPGTSRR